MSEKIEEIKVRAGNFWKVIKLRITPSKIECQFAYNKILLDEIRNMEGAKWHGYDEVNPRKIWSIKNSHRNWFNLHYLMGINTYEPYEQEFISFETNRTLYDHQKHMTSHLLTVHHGIWAAEMGTGKTLSFIEVLDYAKKTGFAVSNEEAWYIGPRAGVKAVGRELLKWDAQIRPRMFTYEGLVRELKNWTDIRPVPKIVCFDESSKIKSPNAQRSQAALHLANNIREKYGRDGYIVEMSGSPAPKDPTDWWHQCEVACPGFLKEGSIAAFKKRLCIIEQRESLITGGVYPHLVTWLNDPEKCSICGQYRNDPIHTELGGVFDVDPKQAAAAHAFKESINEVALLRERTKGLVVVFFKKDCLDLPDKQYEIIRAKPSVEMLQAAKLIKKMATRAIEALTLLRELADGFQYKQQEKGEQTCRLCAGKKTIEAPFENDSINHYEQVTTDIKDSLSEIKTQIIECPTCGGKGTEPVYETVTYEIGTPKDEVFIEELDAAEDIGRFIVWGGFTGTLDRLVRIALQQGWAVLRVDGRGYLAKLPSGELADSDELLSAMDRTHPKAEELRETYPRVCFVGNPEAGGMALTLTASPIEFFFSNSFKGEARMQSEDRAHRIGMDSNRGLIIKDLFLLPSDEYVYNNLKLKKELQSVSLGEFQAELSVLEKKYEENING